MHVVPMHGTFFWRMSWRFGGSLCHWLSAKLPFICGTGENQSIYSQAVLTSHWLCFGPVFYSPCFKKGDRKVQWKVLPLFPYSVSLIYPNPVPFLTLHPWSLAPKCGQQS